MIHAAFVVTMAIAAGSTVAVLGTTAASASAVDDLVGAKYVALGDSFAAGVGLAPYSATPAPGCLQSTGGIAAQVSAELQLELTDVSCSGATIADVLSTRQSVAGGSVPPQLEALTADTALVSLMVGGNDAGFSTVLPSCTAFGAEGPLLLDYEAPSCAAKYGDQVSANLRAVVRPSLDALLAAIHRKSPDATVVLLGYPAIAPTDEATPETGCYSARTHPAPQNAFPFTSADRSWIAGLSAQLNAVQQASAEQNGAIFVSNLEYTDSHTPCAGTAEPWLNGINITLPPTRPGFDPDSLHPNSAGAAYLAGRLAAVFAEATPPAQSGGPGSTPEGPGAGAPGTGAPGTGAPGTGAPGEPGVPGTSDGQGSAQARPPRPATTSGDPAGATVARRTGELANTGSDAPSSAGTLGAAGLAALGAGAALLLRRRRARPS